MFEETKLWDWSCECRGLCRNLDRSDKSISSWVNYENATQRPLTVVNSIIWNYNQVTKLIKLWRSLIHFCRPCKFGRYSDNYLLQDACHCWSTIENSLDFCHQRWQCLSRTNCCIKRILKIFLTERIVRSQYPPMCDAPAKLNFHLMFF